ncbi:phosphodiester glycosidase family protein [Lewinella sp. LCG006]|uniref:phosphodiester glycosidase family protein n=1 Tax=Lewinella sp. LCG006 TaxID=3231911 RepID=UPI00345F6F25
MRKNKIIGLVLILIALAIIAISWSSSKDTSAPKPIDDPQILSYVIDLEEDPLVFYSTDESGEYFENHGRLKQWLAEKNKKLIFAMNGGMYLPDLSPQGLYIEDGIKKKQIDRQHKGYGNFYLYPNGIFYITDDHRAFVVSTENYVEKENHRYATQSGPMLLVNGEIHPKFNEGSTNLHIRNGVGVLPTGQVLFAMSKEKINFFHFAQFFQKHGCQNALYLDGFVSRTYLPGKNWVQEDGRYGIIIAQVE